jgi:hypothetical protein
MKTSKVVVELFKHPSDTWGFNTYSRVTIVETDIGRIDDIRMILDRLWGEYQAFEIFGAEQEFETDQFIA